MKMTFLWGLVLLIPVGIFAALVYMFGHAIYSIISDWLLRRETDALRAEGEARREKKRLENEERLNNGCEHAFGRTMGVFPPNACPKCGLEKERPAGDCDHVWKRSLDPVPSCVCAKCGKKYQRLASV